MITPFENETRSVSSCTPAILVLKKLRVHVADKTTSTEETSHAWEPLQVVPAD